MREEPVDRLPDLPPNASLLVDPVELTEQQQAVLDALDRLPPRQREVIAWSVDGFTPDEIARQLGIAPEAVRVSLHKARTALKRILGLEQGGGR
jgi:RNA polymerase sigma-70 factor (ECF subfamily)